MRHSRIFHMIKGVTENLVWRLKYKKLKLKRKRKKTLNAFRLVMDPTGQTKRAKVRPLLQKNNPIVVFFFVLFCDSSQYGRGGWFHGYSFVCQPVDYSLDEMAVRVSFDFSSISLPSPYSLHYLLPSLSDENTTNKKKSKFLF